MILIIVRIENRRRCIQIHIFKTLINGIKTHKTQIEKIEAMTEFPSYPTIFNSGTYTCGFKLIRTKLRAKGSSKLGTRMNISFKIVATKWQHKLRKFKPYLRAPFLSQYSFLPFQRQSTLHTKGFSTSKNITMRKAQIIGYTPIPIGISTFHFVSYRNSIGRSNNDIAV